MKKQKEKGRPSAAKLDMLTAIENINDVISEYGMDDSLMQHLSNEIEYIAKKQEISDIQALLLAVMIEESEHSEITLSDLAESLDCSKTRMLRYSNEIEGLVHREMINSIKSNHELTYSIPADMLLAVREDVKYVPQDYSGMTTPEFFSLLDDMFESLELDELSPEMLIAKTQRIIKNNGELPFVQGMKQYHFMPETELILMYIASETINRCSDSIDINNMRNLFNKRASWVIHKNMILNGIHPLQNESVIEYGNNDGLADRESVRLTSEARSRLMPDIQIRSRTQNSQIGLNIKHHEIAVRNLFFDEKVSAQIDELRKLLDETQFSQIRQRLKDEGFRNGFTCLFHGAPGTGKTETVLQLARQTQRNIVQVNLSNLKSMWVGESERNVKQVFEDYRRMTFNNDKIPILLFNEADAIIGRRLEGADRAVEKMENSLQNIILQEMESLEGIMIATTNLVQNMDRAFERRFLYKVNFSKPSAQVRAKIWHELLPSVDETLIQNMAQHYEFSGGQIENVARHMAIDRILYGDTADTQQRLEQHCQNERSAAIEHHTIGF
ncbi:MAG: ATP-binding protein [Bacteroidales bacterium]|nr:ATP-binding protein [Bacteroidales bacterium]